MKPIFPKLKWSSIKRKWTKF